MSAAVHERASAPETSRLAAMHPAYFAMVMATGIVSIAGQLLGLPVLAKALFALNAVFYAVLWVLLVVRLARHRARVLADLMHHGRSVGFFTIIAATSVLGSQCLLVGQNVQAALGLWWFAVGLWVVLVYTIFAVLTVKPEKPSLSEGLNGGWLVSVVAAQSVSVLGAQLAPAFDSGKELVLFFCTAMWLGGGMLYFWIISLIFYRYTFFAMSPADLAPPYWVNMGAAAISTLAGTMLVSAAPHSPVLEQLAPFVRGLTLMWWATATWWIPMLVVLGVWRHVMRRFPLHYDPLYWAAVFPLGMYTTCTYRLSQVVAAPYLLVIAQGFVYVAFAAWCVEAAAMAAALLSGSRSQKR